MKDSEEIGVLGSGPAALAIASALSRRGANVLLVAPAPEAAWKSNYCLWADEVPAGFENLDEHSWPEVSVMTDLGTRHLAKAYVKLDVRALQSVLWERFQSGTARVVDARATRLEQHRDATAILTDDGRSHRVRLVVDASGGGSAFVRRVHGRPPAFQTAYGLLLDAPAHAFDPQRMVFMDFRAARSEAPDPPSFLYALPLPDGRLFLEETSLASRPAAPSKLLRARLESRLRKLGLERCERLAEEHCSIPMGLGLPARAQSVVPFGAAASMVHPASGYLIAHVMRKSEPLSESILSGLEQGGATRAVAAGNEVVWPSFQRRTWEIYTLGLEALVAMNSDQTTRFFDSFFQMTVEEWYGFLGGRLAPMQLGRIMLRLFGGLPASLRWKLLETSLSTGAAPIARTLLQPGMR